jgi:hypothetical protein
LFFFESTNFRLFMGIFFHKPIFKFRWLTLIKKWYNAIFYRYFVSIFNFYAIKYIHFESSQWEESNCWHFCYLDLKKEGKKLIFISNAMRATRKSPQSAWNLFYEAKLSKKKMYSNKPKNRSSITKISIVFVSGNKSLKKSKNKGLMQKCRIKFEFLIFIWKLLSLRRIRSIIRRVDRFIYGWK